MLIGECLFTHLFLSKLRLNRPKTNHKCQKYVVFVFLHMQVQILKKWTKITRKRQHEHENGKGNKEPRPGKDFSRKDHVYAQMLQLAIGIILQSWSLNFVHWQNWPLLFLPKSYKVFHLQNITNSINPKSVCKTQLLPSPIPHIINQAHTPLA